MTVLAKRNGSLFPLVLNDLFDSNEFFRSAFDMPWDLAVNVPSVNIMEDEKSYKVEMAVPGQSKKDFKIELKNNMLVISSEKEEEKKENRKNYKRQEFSYSSFSRAFQLPEDALEDKIDAKYEDGILRLDIPKKEATTQKAKKEIKIS